MSLFLTSSKKVLEALKFAEKYHAKQYRKFTNEPYIIHPIRVASTIASITVSEDILISALLHDVVEMNPQLYNEIVSKIEEKFGKDVLQYVLELTNPTEIDASYFEVSRCKRKLVDLDHLVKASPTAKLIKLADMIDNLSTMEFNSDTFRYIYMHELKDKLLECYGVNSILQNRLEKLMRNL